MLGLDPRRCLVKEFIAAFPYFASVGKWAVSIYVDLAKCIAGGADGYL